MLKKFQRLIAPATSERRWSAVAGTAV